MWAAVTFATRWRSSLLGRIALGVWAAAALAGVTALIWSTVTVQPLVFVAALAGPVPFALLWGVRRYQAGVVGGYTLWLVAVPALLNICAYGAYWLAERALRRARAARSEQTTAELPGPPPYSSR